MLLALVGLARLARRTWWAWGAGATAALVVAGSFAYPLVVEPVFNDHVPLAAGPLRTELLALAERDGVEVDEVLVADASRRTTALNAYVSGFGSTRRIVLYDTLVDRRRPRRWRLVVAHELGHAEERDVLTGTLLGALGGGAAGVCAAALLLTWQPLLRRAGADGGRATRGCCRCAGARRRRHAARLPGGQPGSRRIEARADLHALDLTRDPATFVAVQQRLAVRNLSDLDPDPLAYSLFATHPSTVERPEIARAWA